MWKHAPVLEIKTFVSRVKLWLALGAPLTFAGSGTGDVELLPNVSLRLLLVTTPMASFSPSLSSSESESFAFHGWNVTEKPRLSAALSVTPRLNTRAAAVVLKYVYAAPTSRAHISPATHAKSIRSRTPLCSHSVADDEDEE